MNIKKINDKINANFNFSDSKSEIKNNSDDFIDDLDDIFKPTESDESDKLAEPENSLETINYDEQDINLYTENPELIEEIDRYKKQRKDSINILVSARDNIEKLITDKDYINSILVGKGQKDIEALSKLLTSLTTITDKIDILSSPSKVEIFIDPPESKKQKDDDKPVVNIQNNFYGNPAELIKIMKGETENNE